LTIEGDPEYRCGCATGPHCGQNSKPILPNGIRWRAALNRVVGRDHEERRIGLAAIHIQ
jgi:hypothetical protein